VMEAAADRLKQLTREYADGELDFATYRHLRGELLDSLVSAAAPVVVPTERNRIPRRALWSVIAVGTVGGLAWLASEGGLLSIRPESTPSAQRVVEEFLRRRDWSDDRVAQLHATWSSLPEAQRRSLRSTASLQELTDAIRLRIKEQRALADGQDNARISPSLVRLAQDFGVEKPE
jgi:hypothetical protein